MASIYIKSENIQAQQSKKQLTEALLTLMGKFPYDEITITQICQEAQVVRQTFYRNFEFKIDILKLYVDKMMYGMTSNCYLEMNLEQQLKNYYEYMFTYKDFLFLIEKNNLSFLIKEALTDIISKFTFVTEIMDDIKESNHNIYVLDFIASTICSIISLWIKNDFREYPEMLATFSKTFLSGLENIKLKKVF